jgi:hypothetical protein
MSQHHAQRAASPHLIALLAYYTPFIHAKYILITWPWDGHYKSILLPADEEIMGSL